MTSHDSDSRELVELIRGVWTPPPSDPGRFEAGLHVRLRSQRRRHTLVVAAVAAVGLLVAASHLIGDPAEPGSEPALRPDTAVAPSAMAAADDPVEGLFWSQALDHEQRGYALPGAYGALDSLFLQPYDQEL